MKWLREGDANTAFFHQSTIQRRRHNSFVKIKDSDGRWTDNLNRVRTTMEDHFIKLFTSEGPRDWGSTVESIDHLVTREMNSSLTCSIEDQEIKEAV